MKTRMKKIYNVQLIAMSMDNENKNNNAYNLYFFLSLYIYTIQLVQTFVLHNIPFI